MDSNNSEKTHCYWLSEIEAVLEFCFTFIHVKTTSIQFEKKYCKTLYGSIHISFYKSTEKVTAKIKKFSVSPKQNLLLGIP